MLPRPGGGECSAVYFLLSTDGNLFNLPMVGLTLSLVLKIGPSRGDSYSPNSGLNNIVQLFSETLGMPRLGLAYDC